MITVVVVFMPIVLALARKHDLVASRFLIPLSYAAIVGGTCTIIGTSTNLVASGIAKDAGLNEFGMFEVTKLGAVFVVVTFFYMLFIGRKLLPDRVTLSTLFDSNQDKEFFTTAVVSESSELLGKKLADTSLSKIRQFRVIEVSRRGKKINSPISEVFFELGDQLLIKSRIEGVVDAGGSAGIKIGIESRHGLQELQTNSAVLIEGVIGPGSSLVGKSLEEAKDVWSIAKSYESAGAFAIELEVIPDRLAKEITNRTSLFTISLEQYTLVRLLKTH